MCISMSSPETIFNTTYFSADNFYQFSQYNDSGEKVDEREWVSVVQWAGKTHSALVSKGIAASR